MLLIIKFFMENHRPFCNCLLDTKSRREHPKIPNIQNNT